jgi:hypothetical protein
VAPQSSTLQPSTPQPPASATALATPSTGPAKTTDNGLPPGADQIIFPYSGQDTDLSGAEPAIIRDFVTRHGKDTLYVVRAFASAPKGDDDPSDPRRIALFRAQAVQSALMDAGAQPTRVRLLALGNVGGPAPDRVELIAMPPSSGHTAPSSSP